MKSSSVRAKKRFLWKRDGNRCWLCGGVLGRLGDEGPWEPTLDHIIPRSRDGSNAIENLRLAHKLCNGRRGSTHPDRSIAKVAMAKVNEFISENRRRK